MSHGFSGASRQLCRRRRWLSLLPEESPAESARGPRRPSAESDEAVPAAPQSTAAPVSSLLPRRTWVLALLVLCGFMTWATVVGVGAWLDIHQMDPWRDILGIRSGRLLRFYTTIALLSCAQLSYLILWRRSRSRKDFGGRYRVWFWVGAVCSIFCVASASRFHEVYANQLTTGMSLVWVDAGTVCWLVPATTMLLSAMHLIRRDMLHRSASKAWTQVSRGLAVLTGFSLLFGSLLWPEAWVAPINAALGALWPTVFASTLLIHARYVTYVTNEASREQRQPSRSSRWEARLKSFAQHVALQASEEWQLYRQTRAAKAALLSAESTKVAAPLATVVEVPAPRARPEQPARERRTAPASPSARASAPLQQLSQSRASMAEEDDEESLTAPPPAPVTTAINARPLPRPPAPAAIQPARVHPAQPIPAPHFAIEEPELMESEATGESDNESQSQSIPAGYSPEQWRNLSKKDRKRLRRTEAVR